MFSELFFMELLFLLDLDSLGLWAWLRSVINYHVIPFSLFIDWLLRLYLDDLFEPLWLALLDSHKLLFLLEGNFLNRCFFIEVSMIHFKIDELA